MNAQEINLIEKAQEKKLIEKALENIEADLIYRKKNLSGKMDYLKNVKNLERFRNEILMQYENDETDKKYNQEMECKTELKKVVLTTDNQEDENILIISNDRNNFHKIDNIQFNNFVSTNIENTVNSYIWCDTIGRKLYKYHEKEMKHIYAHQLYTQNTTQLFEPYIIGYKEYSNYMLNEIEKKVACNTLTP